MRHVDAVGLWCALGYAALAVLARQPGEPDLALFFLLAAWTGLPVFGLYLYFRRRGDPFPVGRLLLWAVVFRICGLAGGPFYEDDFYRYLWDAYRFATAGTPYGAAPEQFFVDPAVPALFQGVLDGINYPELPTIYGPTTQFVFLLGYWLQPASVTALQAILIAVDLATVVLLLRLTRPANVLLYAWCPLVVKEIAFTAHPDGAGACLLVAAMCWPEITVGEAPRRVWVWPPGPRRSGWCWAPLVLARARLGHWIVFGANVGRCTGPSCCSAAPISRRAGLRPRMGIQLGALRAAGDRGAPVRVQNRPGSLVRAVLGILQFVYARRAEHRIPRGDWLYGALLAVSPVINPW